MGPVESGGRKSGGGRVLLVTGLVLAVLGVGFTGWTLWDYRKKCSAGVRGKAAMRSARVTRNSPYASGAGRDLARVVDGLGRSAVARQKAARAVFGTYLTVGLVTLAAGLGLTAAGWIQKRKGAASAAGGEAEAQS